MTDLEIAKINETIRRREGHIRPRRQGGLWFLAQRMRVLEVLG